jgi:hypothetical protein
MEPITDPKNIAAVLVSLGAICWITNQILKLVGSLRGTKEETPRREISFAGQPVDLKDFDKLAAENTSIHNQLFAKMGGVERGTNAALMKYEEGATASRQAMHREIAALGERIKGVETDTNSIKHEVGSLRESIEDLPDRILNMIEKIKALGK